MRHQNIFVYLTIVSLISLTNLFSEESGLSLREVLKKAQSKTNDMVLIQKKLEADLFEIKSFKSAVWPLVKLSSSGSYTSQKSFFGSSGGPPNPALFSGGPSRMSGTQYSWQIQLEQPLITFGRLGVLKKIANKSEKIAHLNYDLKKQEYYLNVIHGYNQLLMAQSEMDNFSSQLSQLKALTSIVKLEYENGIRNKSEFLVIQSQLKRAISDSIRAGTDFNSTLARLNHLVESNYSHENISLEIIPSSFLEKSENLQSHEKKEIILGQHNSNMSSDWVKYERSNLLPAISLFSNVSSTIFEFENLSQGRPVDLINPNSFDYQIGLKLNWTLFDGFATTSKVKQQKAETVIAQREWIKLKQDVEISQKESLERLKSSEQVLLSSLDVLSAYTLTSEQAEIDYKEGILSLSEYLEIQSQYSEAKRMTTISMAERIIALANYRLAYGISLVEGI